MIRTVLGDIDSADLGTTMSHEHLLMTGGWPIRQVPDWLLDSQDAAVEELAPFVAAGGRAVVEMTPFGFGRDPRGLAEIARRTNVHIICATGFHKADYYAGTHWIHHYSAEEIADLLVEEIEVGADQNGMEGPLKDQTEVRAGVIKFATEYFRVRPVVEKLAEAVGAAHRRTGAPVSTHTDKGTMGHEQLDLLEEAGVSADRVLLGHIDHNPDAGYLSDLAARGAYLVCDMPGRIKYAPDSQTLDLLVAVAHRGHGDRVLLGLDLARRSYWRSLGGGPGMGYLLEQFVPRMRRRDLDDLARAALITNPALAFQITGATA